MAERRGKKPSEAELDLWHTVMRDAVPLRGAKRRPKVGGDNPVPTTPAPPPPTVPATRVASSQPPVAPPLADRLADLLRGVPVKQKAAVTVQLAPAALGARGGIDKRTDEKVRRGRAAIDGRIDLHGLTQSEAHDALIGFVRRSYAQGRRLLLVITGKGGMPRGEGVLRSSVPRWLHESPVRDLVLAVHQAQPHHGGGGAYYVYLRRRREG